MVLIENLRRIKPSEPYDFYIDRRSPFTLNNESMRNEVCDLYEEYFNSMLMCGDIEFKNYLSIMVKTLKLYGKLRLFCWCNPRRCHGETIKKYLDSKFDGPLF